MQRPEDNLAEWLRERMRAALRRAQMARDGVAVTALRTAIAAVDNAEVPSSDGRSEKRSGQSSQHFAGAVAGLGAGEVSRRKLSRSELRAILDAEIDERLRAAEHYAEPQQAKAAARLRREAAILTEFRALLE